MSIKVLVALCIICLLPLVAFAAPAAIEVSRFKLSVLEGKNEIVSHTPVYPKAISDVVKVASNQVLTASFSLKDVTPHQVFARLVHEPSQEEFIFVAKPSTDGYTVRIDMKKAAADVFDNRSGTYSVQLIAGDSSNIKPLLWNLGSVSLDLGARAPTKEDEEAALYAPRPIITHMFRRPEPRAPAAVSSVFTLLVLAPFAVLFVGLIYVKANLSNFPTGAGFLYAVAFHLCIAAMLGVIAWYWLEINIFQASAYLAILGSVTALVGTKALGYLAAYRKQKSD